MTETISKTPDARPMIQIERLGKVYRAQGREIRALEDVNLEVRKGDIFGIIGVSGAGKSTLVRCINLLERPTEGRVLVDGQDVSRLSPRELRGLRRSAAMIFQQFNLLMQRNVLKNVRFPLEIAGWERAKATRRAAELLERVGLADKKTAYPSQLSGGQKQRVAIARALALKPKLLLSDEATSALDPVTTRSILELLKSINRETGITIVVITHQMNVIRAICNRVAVLDDSHIVETGPVDKVLNSGNEMTRRLFASLESKPEGSERRPSLSADRPCAAVPGPSAGQPSAGAYRLRLEPGKLAGVLERLVEQDVPVELRRDTLPGAELPLLAAPASAEAVFRMRRCLDSLNICYEEADGRVER